jgi:LCP family protein required for cell wall assembly
MAVPPTTRAPEQPPAPPAPPPAETSYYTLPPRRRRWPWVVGSIAFALVAVAGALVAGALVDAQKTLNKVSPNTPEVRAARQVLDKPTGKAVNVLLLGSDRRLKDASQGARSDSIILVRLDPQRSAISLLSIPRDLRVSIPGYGPGYKINAAYSLGGPKLAIETVQQTLHVPVNHWVDINFQGFFDLVQYLKGVYIQVDRRYYNPNVPGATYAPIDLHPGYQRLSGNDALAYVRFRHNDSDFIRADRQQLFLLELKRQASRRIGLSDLPGLINIFEHNVVTDVHTIGTTISLVQLILGLPKDRVFRTTLQATPGPSFVDASPTQIANSLATFETPPLPGQSSSLVGAGAVRPQGIRVHVQNAGAGFGAASTVTAILRRRGYVATSDGDAPPGTTQATSLYFEGGTETQARALTARLDNVPARLAPPDAAGGPGLVLVLGAGFPVTHPFKPPAPKVAHAVRRPKGPPMVADPAPRQLAKGLGGVGLRVLVPTLRPAGSRLARQDPIRAYRIKAGGRDSFPALVYTFEDDSNAGRFWNVQETTMPDPPLLGLPTTVTPPRANGRRYQLYFDGSTLRTLAFRAGDTWYWISNTLDGSQTERAMLAVADGLKPLNPPRHVRRAVRAHRRAHRP